MAGTEAAATDPLLHEPDCPVGFKPDGTDSENAAMFKSIIVAPAGDGLEAKLKDGTNLLQTMDGRTELVTVLQQARIDPEVDAQTYENIVALLGTALQMIVDNDDCDNAMAYIDIVGAFRTGSGDGARTVGDHPTVKKSPLWQDMKLWQETIFEVVSRERAKATTPRAGSGGGEDAWSTADEEQRQLKIMQEQNVAFGQIQTVAMHMLDFGTQVDKVVAFVKRLQDLELLTSPEHIEMLCVMMSDKSGKKINLSTGEVSGMATSHDPVAEAQAEADRVAQARAEAEIRSFGEAEPRAVEEAQQQLQPHLLPGAGDDGSGDEKVIANAGRVGVRLMDGTVYSGVLFVTTYRLAFVTKEIPGVAVEIPVLTLLDTNKKNPDCVDGMQIEKSIKMAPGSWGPGVELPVTVLKVICKDVRELSFIFDDDIVMLLEAAACNNADRTRILSTRVQESAAQLKAEKNAANALTSLTKIASSLQEEETQSPTEARASGFREMVEAVVRDAIPSETDTPDGEYVAFRHKSVAVDEAGTCIYDARAEFERQGALQEDSGWRETTLNHEFELCSTYPKVLLFPKTMEDSDIKEVSKFRSKQRLPSLSWLHPENRAAIVRCAQPLVGITGKKSEADEKLFTEIQRANGGGNGVSMLDARPWANAVANKGRKGGYEKLDNYEGSDATLVFLNIDNIHVMRNSLYGLHGLIRSNQTSGPVSRADINDTGWPAYVGRVLGGGATIVSEIENKGRTCVVHCSDGWDRTAQLAAVPALCMEPYYRTNKGFRVLCQREWNSFGHKFRDRTYGLQKRHERSPIFFQFLDCVQCIMHKYPEAFEFNEWFLLQAADALHSMAYSDYRCNHEKGTIAERENRTPASMWSLLYGDRAAEFSNPAYDPETHGRVLQPPVEARSWVAYFNRWTEDPIYGQPKGMLGVAYDALTKSAADRPKRTFEELVLGATKAPVPPRFVEVPYRYSGDLWQVSGKMKKDKKRWCILHGFVDGEASLVYYEKEKSESTVPTGIIPLHEAAFSVETMPLRTNDPANATGRTYFQVRWKTEGDAAAREAAKEEMEKIANVLTLVTEDSQDKSPEEFTRELQNKAMTASPQLSYLLAVWFARRLKSDAVATRIKTLKLVDAMVEEGNGSFRLAMQKNCVASIEACKSYNPPADPEHGDKPAQLVRRLSGKIGANIAEAHVAEQVAGVPEVRTVFSAPAGDVDGWLDAFKDAAGQDDILPADETLDVDVLDVAAESLKVVGAGATVAMNEVTKFTKRFSGKATAPILESDEGSDDGVNYQMANEEITVKAKKTEVVKWELESGWQVRWKLVCGPHNVGYSAYFVAKAPLRPEQTPEQVDAAFAELEPMLSACTADSEHKQPPEQVEQLKEMVSGASIEISNRVTYWLSKRSKEPSVAVKLKTIRLIAELLDSGNANYQLATKRNCTADLQAAKVFTADPDPTHGDKPRDMVRGKARVLADRLAAAPDEAREMLMEPATIPAEGTVRSGFEVAKSGTLVMVFDNTYSKMRAKRITFSFALQPDPERLVKLVLAKMLEGYVVTKIGGGSAPRAAEAPVQMRESVTAQMLDEEQVEGAIEQRVEELIEDENADRAEVIALLVQFAGLATPSKHLSITVESLKDARLGSGPDVEEELQAAITAQTRGGTNSYDLEPEPQPAAVAAVEESDEDDSL